MLLPSVFAFRGEVENGYGNRKDTSCGNLGEIDWGKKKRWEQRKIGRMRSYFFVSKRSSIAAMSGIPSRLIELPPVVAAAAAARASPGAGAGAGVGL
jgi:hypothetical protein